MSNHSNNYNSKDIKALSDIEAIRLRPGMYIGATEAPSHLFQEAFDNAIDESLAGRAKNIKVEVDDTNKIYTVEDDGSGIPMGSMKVEILGHVFDKQSLELLTSKGHVGGKFGGKSYSISSGLHGVGLKAISALSDKFVIETCRIHDDNEKWTVGRIEYSKGKLINQTYEEVKSKKSYTRVSLKADNTIFTSDEIPKSYIINKCKIASAFGHKVKLFIDNEEYDLGEPTLMSLIEVEEGVKDISNPIELKAQVGEEFVQVCMQYFDDLSSRVKGFTNLLYNSQGGTHNRLFERTIVKAWRRVEGKDSILKDSDFLLGMRGVVACFISNPAFTSQTKERLSVNNSMIQPFMDKLEDAFVKWLNKNYEVRDLLLRKFNTFRQKQNELLASKEIKGIVKVAEVKGGKVRRKSMMAGMIECSNPIAGETELFITEGESALGSIKQARDTRIHAGIPLRGKCLNVAGMDFVNVLKNKEMLGIVNAIGAGIGDDCKAENSRYGKIIITADSDPDGLHITNLVMSALINLVPDLVKKGMVYIAPGYLYGYYDKVGEFHGCHNKEDIPKDAKRWSRYKGLGELNPQEFFDFYMNKDKRVLEQVDYPESLTDFNNLMNRSKRSLLEEEGVIIYK